MSCCALALCECGACIACSCCQSCLKGALSSAARMGHLVLLTTIFALAAVLGIYYPNTVNGYGSYSKVNLGEDCYAEYEDACIYRQLMYRASFALFIVFSLLTLGTFYSDSLNKSMWPLKFGVATALFVGFWWGDNSFFSGYAEFARVFAILWLLAQGLLLLDFAHDCHDLIMGKAQEADEENEGSGKRWYIFYIILSLAFLTAACIGLAYLFTDYSGCGLGMFLILVTLLFGIITLFLSLTVAVNKGLLTPCIMFSYSVFMCWYALLSSPKSGCNPTADQNDGDEWSICVTVLILVSATAMLYCIVNGTVILNAFSPKGEGVLQSYKPKKERSSKTELNAVLTGEKIDRSSTTDTPSKSKTADEEEDEPEEPSGSPYERSFFHVLLLLLSIYLCMMLTNWGKTNGNVLSNGSEDVANESLWFKVLSQWAFIAMYLRILQLAYQENEENSYN